MKTTKYYEKLLEPEDNLELNFIEGVNINNGFVDKGVDLTINSGFNKDNELIKIHLSDINKLPLLSATEEVYYSKLSKKG